MYICIHIFIGAPPAGGCLAQHAGGEARDGAAARERRYYPILYYPIPYYTILYCTMLCYAILYYTIL